MWLLLACPQLPLSSSVIWVFCETTQTSQPATKKSLFFCCKNTCHYLHPNKNNISFPLLPSFILSLSLSLSPPKTRKGGPPKFLGQFPKSQVPPKKEKKKKNKSLVCCIEFTVVAFSRFPFLSFIVVLLLMMMMMMVVVMMLLLW